MISEATRRYVLGNRLVVGGLLLYFFLSFTSFLTGITHLYPQHYLGYLYGGWVMLDHFSSTVSEPITHFVLRTIVYVSVPFLLLGTLFSALLFMVLLLLLLIPLLIVQLGVKLASISIVGAVIVFLVAGIVIAALLRKHWESIVEAVAWVTVLVEGVWRWFFPAKESDPRAAGIAQRKVEYAKGDVEVMQKGSEERQPVAPDRRDSLTTDGHFRRPKAEPVLISYISRVRSDATAKALKSEAEMVRSGVDLGRAILEGHDLETDIANREMKREEKTIVQETRVEEAKAKLEGIKASRAEESKLPQNPTDRLFEKEYKPTIANGARAEVHKAKSRAEALIQASQAAFEYEAAIDRGPGTPEQKAELKKRVRMEFESVFKEKPQKQKAASASPYAEDHEE